MAIGIYKIRNLKNDKIYIGSSINLIKRQRDHFRSLNLKNHYNLKLQRAFNKYGKDNFIFEIILECSVEDLLKMEQYYIDTLMPSYNIRTIANSNLGTKRNALTKLKMRNAQLGKKISNESRLKMSAKRFGIKLSDETKLRMKISANNSDKIGTRRSVSKICPITLNILEVYKSIAEAGIKNNIHKNGISNCLAGVAKTSGNFKWKYHE